jgi:pimeloyl-ACP methyl ester carboxylesterase
MRDGPVSDRVLRLRGGRALAYAERGDLRGLPVFFFGGILNSRLWCPDEQATQAAGVRLITVDRPGYGRSDVQPGHTLGAWPEDVLELAGELGLERFGVVGWSAGGRYAAACAALMPDRLTGVGIVCSAAGATYELAEQSAALEMLDEDGRRLFELVRELGPTEAACSVAAEHEEWARRLVERPESIYPDLELAEGDRWFFDDPERCASLFDSVREALRQGPLGYAWAWVACVPPWGFRLADIAIPVRIWHGQQDTWMPGNSLKLVVDTIPNTSLTVWPDVGHWGVTKYWRELLDAVTAAG